MSRFEYLISQLPRDSMVELEIKGTRADADKYIARELPQWCTDVVLLSADVLPHIFASLPTSDGSNIASVCRAWTGAWPHTLRQRKLPLRHVRTLDKLEWEAPADVLHVELDFVSYLTELRTGEVIIAIRKGGDGAGEAHLYLLSHDLKIRGQAALGDDVSDVTVGSSAIFVVVETSDTVMSLSLHDLSQARDNVVLDFVVHSLIATHGRLLASTTHSLCNSNELEIVVLDEETLTEQSRFGGGLLGSPGDGATTAMTVLNDELFLTTCRDRCNLRAEVHVFSLLDADGNFAPKHARSSVLEDVWRIEHLGAGHDRLYATEHVFELDVSPAVQFHEGDEKEVEQVSQQVQWDIGKRIVVLSPQLEVLCFFRGDGSGPGSVPGDHDYWAITPYGENGLIVSNLEDEKIHVLACGAA